MDKNLLITLFLNDINSELGGGFKLEQLFLSDTNSLTFELVINSKYVAGGAISPNDQYRELIEEKVATYFDVNHVRFNNTWCVFWFSDPFEIVQ